MVAFLDLADASWRRLELHVHLRNYTANRNLSPRRKSTGARWQRLPRFCNGGFRIVAGRSVAQRNGLVGTQPDRPSVAGYRRSNPHLAPIAAALGCTGNNCSSGQYQSRFLNSLYNKQNTVNSSFKFFLSCLVFLTLISLLSRLDTFEF